MEHKKSIKVSDRATIFNLMVGLNGYTISSGIISSKLNDDKIVVVPLDVEDTMEPRNLTNTINEIIEGSRTILAYVENTYSGIRLPKFKILIFSSQRG